MTPASRSTSRSTAERFRADRDSRWYVAMAWLAFAVVFVGFLPTFILPLARGTFRAPGIVYAHAALVLAWLVLFAVQATLIRGARIRAHRRTGSLALGLVPGIVATGIDVGVWAMRRDVAAGGGATAVSGLLGTVTSLLLFGLLVAAGLAYRRRPDMHKRLMLLATLSILWPAWFRFRHHFPSVPHPDIVFAIVFPDLWILLAMLRDRLAVGRVHPVYLVAGLGLIAEQVAEAIWFDTPGWRAIANRLADLLS
jgi:hypothetical protein